MNAYTVAITDNTIGAKTFRVNAQDAMDALKDAFYQAYSQGMKSDYDVNSITLTRLNTVN